MEGWGVGRVRQGEAGLGSNASSIIYEQCGLRQDFNVSELWSLKLFKRIKCSHKIGKITFIGAAGMWQLIPVFSENVYVCV